MILSILIPVFDGRIFPYLDLTLKSLKNQKIEENIEIETIILNDGLPSNGSKEIADKYGYQYIFTGQRNVSKIFWRTAGFAFNIGLKAAKGDLILCQEPEVFLMDSFQLNKMIKFHKEENKIAVHPKKIYIDTGILLNLIKQNIIPPKEVLDQFVNNYHAYFWYSLMLKKKDLMEINGWEESCLGECYDDGIFYEQLKNYGMKFVSLDSECVHMYHPRQNTPHYLYNKALYEKVIENKTIKSNLNKSNWGTNDWKNIWE